MTSSIREDQKNTILHTCIFPTPLPRCGLRKIEACEIQKALTLTPKDSHRTCQKNALNLGFLGGSLRMNLLCQSTEEMIIHYGKICIEKKLQAILAIIAANPRQKGFKKPIAYICKIQRPLPLRGIRIGEANSPGPKKTCQKLNMLDLLQSIPHRY